VRYAELARDGRHGFAAVEGFHEHAPVRGLQVLQCGKNELPVQDLVQSRIGPDLGRSLWRSSAGPERPG
jgi:hypothetical protein